MPRKPKRRTNHWSQRPERRDTTFPYIERTAPTRDPLHEAAHNDAPHNLGPYEARYDITLGYGHVRAIILP